ncbi:MAG: hypothetical protein ABIB79_03335 [archaeon]
MKKSSMIMILLLFLLIGNLLFLYSLYKNDEPLDDHYTYTKAVCNDTNLCQDYKLVCKNGTLVEMSPIGEKVQFSPKWKDPRDIEQINKTC